MQELDSDIIIHVRSPSLNETLIVTTKLNATVLNLKESIEPVHPHHPTADNQRIIYSGKLLQDEELLCNIIKNAQDEAAPIFHLVVKPTLPSQSSSQSFSQPQTFHQPQSFSQPIQPIVHPTPTINETLPSLQPDVNVPAYPSVLPGGYQVVAINGQYYLAPVLVPSQPLPNFTPNTQQQPLPQADPNIQPFINALPQVQNNRPGQRAASIWLALKLIVFLFMVCQGASIERIFIFHLIAFVFFLYQTGRLRFVLRRVRVEDMNQRFRPMAQRAPPPVPTQQGNDDEQEASVRDTTPARPPTTLDIIKRGAYTFFASLWPTYNQDPLIAQAFENNDQREGVI
ncbi:hypothetical protein HPULCUR_010115 [Helicostylum pulchrum]|uniref:Ubiquitin-like domain-containing protein n=1 Tax=Helicostylum pulchrum TaxID=562976 RepID=A0ABP9YCC3_9FUNG